MSLDEDYIQKVYGAMRNSFWVIFRVKIKIPSHKLVIEQERGGMVILPVYLWKTMWIFSTTNLQSLLGK